MDRREAIAAMSTALVGPGVVIEPFEDNSKLPLRDLTAVTAIR